MASFEIHKAVNDGNPDIELGGAAAEALLVTTVFDSGAQTLDKVTFTTKAASATADKGLMEFYVDEALKLTIDDGGIDVAGNIVVSGTVDGVDLANVVVDADIGSTVQAYNADTLLADVGDNLTAGYTSDAYSGGTQSGAGTYTPAPATSEENFQYIVNGGAFTLAPPATNCSVILHILNNGSAGTITTSGFTLVDGDAFDTTDTNEFMCFIAVCNSKSTLTVKALQ